MPSDTPSNDLPQRFRESLRAAKVLPEGARVVVGVSGRCASVALLHLLHGVAQKHDLRLTVAHVQRGDDTERIADAEFVRHLAERLSLPFDLFVEKETNRAPLLQEARSRRQAAAVATGETLDDAAEEFLETLVSDREGSRLFSGDGGSAIRPLLPFSSLECRAFLTERELTFRQDLDALRLSTMRKKIRLLVVPMLRRHLDRSASEHLASASRLLAEDEMVLQAIAQAARSEAGWRETNGRVSLDLRRWAALPSAIRRRLLADAAAKVSVPLSRATLLALDAHCRALAPDTPMTVGTLNILLERGTLSLRKF